MKRVLITGATTPLGRAVAGHLREDAEVEKVIGVESHSTSDWIEGAELVEFEPDDRELVQFLCGQQVDTVVHCAMAPSRSGSARDRGTADVISTMRLCAAVANPEAAVRSLILVSSSEVYPPDAHAPMLRCESDEISATETEPAASLLEAEDYARDVAAGCPHLNVAILRLAELIGGSVSGPLSALFDEPLVPAPIGFDPPVQWLHGRDAAAAILFAARNELAGIYNVASQGHVRLGEVLETTRRVQLPTLPFELGPLTPLLAAVGLPHIPEGKGPLLRHGSALDTAKLSRAGFRAARDQRDCLSALERRPR
jgi:UDP-glucose 4-epimerase